MAAGSPPRGILPRCQMNFVMLFKCQNLHGFPSALRVKYEPLHLCSRVLPNMTPPYTFQFYMRGRVLKPEYRVQILAPSVAEFCHLPQIT